MMIISNCSTSSTKKKCKSSNTKTRTPQELQELCSTQTSSVSLDYYFSVSKKAAGRGQRKVPAESAIGANFPLSSLEQPDGIFTYIFWLIFMGFSCSGNIPVPWIVWVSVPDW